MYSGSFISNFLNKEFPSKFNVGKSQSTQQYCWVEDTTIARGGSIGYAMERYAPTCLSFVLNFINKEFPNKWHTTIAQDSKQYCWIADDSAGYGGSIGNGMYRFAPTGIGFVPNFINKRFPSKYNTTLSQTCKQYCWAGDNGGAFGGSAGTNMYRFAPTGIGFVSDFISKESLTKWDSGLGQNKMQFLGISFTAEEFNGSIFTGGGRYAPCGAGFVFKNLSLC